MRNPASSAPRKYAEMGFRSQVHGAPTINPARRSHRPARDALPRRGRGLELQNRHGAGDPGFRAGRPRRVSDPSAPVSIMEAPADRPRAPLSNSPTSPAAEGPKRVGPFAVPKAMSSTASATLATWFKIKGVNYSISSACATSNHCIGNAYLDDPDRQTGRDLRRRLRGTRLVAVGPVRRDGRDVLEIQRYAGYRLAPLRHQPRWLRDRRRRRCRGAGRARARQGARRAHLCRSGRLWRDLGRLRHGRAVGRGAERCMRMALSTVKTSSITSIRTRPRRRPAIRRKSRRSGKCSAPARSVRRSRRPRR